MVRTWVSGGQNTEVVDRLRKEIADLEAKRDKLVDSNKSKLFQWASPALKTDKIPPGNLTRRSGKSWLNTSRSRRSSLTRKCFFQREWTSKRNSIHWADFSQRIRIVET